MVRGVSVVCGDRRCALGVLWCGGRRVWPVVAAALVFAVLAPVSGAVVKALGVDNWWWLVGIAAAVGAVGGVVVKHFASRWKRQAKERESRRQAVDRAALRLRVGVFGCAILMIPRCWGASGPASGGDEHWG